MANKHFAEMNEEVLGQSISIATKFEMLVSSSYVIISHQFFCFVAKVMLIHKITELLSTITKSFDKIIAFTVNNFLPSIWQFCDPFYEEICRLRVKISLQIFFQLIHIGITLVAQVMLRHCLSYKTKIINAK